MAMSAHECLTSQEKQENVSSELQQLESSLDAQHIEDHETQPTAPSDPAGAAEGNSAWPVVLGVLTAVLSIGLLIALAVRYRFFRWCLARNGHALLLDQETASQFNQAGALEGEIPVCGMRGRMIHTGESSDDEGDDDDGFIEDNYIIQASVREIEEEEENRLEDAEDSDDELVIPEMI
ncbi:hypothetical protein R3I93_006906 [Phoxinus phoxinus]|uniref:Type III endosome membrane protein TEMP n=1 Tax=Phoxinus phoxinus TaxID=58324 RepID=A0AAN9HC84_9TELE